MEFSQIATLLIFASIFGLFAKFLKQPLFVGYLLGGLILGGLGLIDYRESYLGLSQIGVSLLLFLMGLEMNLSDLRTIGKPAVLAGLGQIIFTSIVGFFIALVLGIGLLPAIYIAIALTFSSTIVIVKLLSEKKDLASLYGKISIGFLLVQDFVAILILMFLGGLKSGNFGLESFAITFVKGAFLIVAFLALSKKVIPSIFERLVAHSNELMFIGAIAWALGISQLVAGPLGFSFEIGGFLAGLALSNLPEHLQIASKTRPLRDFFLTIFFLLLGGRLFVDGISAAIIFKAVIFSGFVLVGNPLIVLLIMGVMGYKKRTSFLAGLTVAQISEFSLILMAMGAFLGHVTATDVSLVILVGVITMTVSTYLILGGDRLYNFFEKYLSIFEREKTVESAFIKKSFLKNHIVLVGCDRTGKRILNFLARVKRGQFIVVDFNPFRFTELSAQNTPVVFGDISDSDVMRAANVQNASLVISTIGNYSDNATLLEDLKAGGGSKPLTIFTSSQRSEAIKLYEKGANYVLVPEEVAGDYIKHLLKVYDTGPKKLILSGKNHFNKLVYQ